MKVLVIAATLFCSLAAISFAASKNCRSCGQTINGTFYLATDKAHGGKVEVCAACSKLESICFACSLPVRIDATELKDGRQLCPRCAKEAITDDEEARRICLETRDELDRSYSRFLTLPATNIVLLMVDRFTLESLFKAPGYARQCPSVFGATRSHDLSRGHQIHSISILSQLSRPRLVAVAAHEFAHAWLNDSVSAPRRAGLAPDAIEGFCELLAYQLMVEHRQPFEQAAIKENPYTRGQLAAFLAAEQRHGFNSIVEWMRFGETDKLDADDPDGVRAVSAKAQATKVSAAPNPPRPAPPVARPTSLKLKGVSGAPGRRFALINDQTFAVMENGRVALAHTNLLIRCLEIRTNSALVVEVESGVTNELFLGE